MAPNSVSLSNSTTSSIESGIEGSMIARSDYVKYNGATPCSFAQNGVHLRRAERHVDTYDAGHVPRQGSQPSATANARMLSASWSQRSVSCVRHCKQAIFACLPDLGRWVGRHVALDPAAATNAIYRLPAAAACRQVVHSFRPFVHDSLRLPRSQALLAAFRGCRLGVMLFVFFYAALSRNENFETGKPHWCRFQFGIFSWPIVMVSLAVTIGWLRLKSYWRNCEEYTYITNQREALLKLASEMYVHQD